MLTINTSHAPSNELVAPKKDQSQPKNQSLPTADATKAAAPDATKAAAPEKAADAASSYRRREGQKPLTQAYKDNWNAICGKKAEEDEEARVSRPRPTNGMVLAITVMNSTLVLSGRPAM